MRAERLIALLAVVGGMFVLVRMVPAEVTLPPAGSTLSFGFIILAAYLFAVLLEQFRLPKITGYILAGMLAGPSVLGLLSREVVAELRLIDDLALTFIALAAGGELRLKMIRERQRSILLTLLTQLVLVYAGVTAVLVALQAVFPFTAGRPLAHVVGISAIAGALAVARSPSSAIAIISETKARGPFTEMTLGVTVAADVLAIFVFAVTLSLAQLLLTPGQELDVAFILALAGEVVASIVLGVLIGKGIALYLERVRAELTIFTLGLAFLITKVSHFLAHVMTTHFDVKFHLEPMLICMAAGFVVQNFSRSGQGFLKVIDRSSLPIFTLFFTMSGAALHLEALRTTWHWALALVGLRGAFLYASSWVGGRLASDPPLFAKMSGLAFLTQAGVSLGLVKVIMDTFPSFGADYATLLVASIAVNQVVGPVGLKVALGRVGETREARLQSKLSR